MLAFPLSNACTRFHTLAHANSTSEHTRRHARTHTQMLLHGREHTELKLLRLANLAVESMRNNLSYFNKRQIRHMSQSKLSLITKDRSEEELDFMQVTFP